MDELVIGRCSDIPDKYRWLLTDRPIDFQCSISPKEYRSIKQSKIRLYEQLKFLHITQSITCQELNRLKQLVHLELNCSLGRARTKVLKLPELKVLKIIGSINFRCVLKLKTPKLESLSCGFISNQFQFKHPESIKWLESNFHSVDFMSKFCNVEVFNYQTRITDLDPNLLTIWTNLRELGIRGLDTYYQTVEQFRSSLLDLLRQSQVSKGVKLRCYIEDVPLVDESLLNDYDPNDPAEFKFKHYKLLRNPQPDVSAIDYNNLMGLVPDLSSDFFAKFPAIEEIRATGPVDRDRFERFLKNVRNLSKLSLIKTSLDEAFLHNLPNIIIGKLSNFLIRETNISFLTDFDFILRFKSLTRFATNQQLDGSLDLAVKAFQLLCFHSFDVRVGDERVVITRLRSINPERFDLDVYELTKEYPSGRHKYCERNLKLAKLINYWKQRTQPQPDPAAPPSSKRLKAGP